MIQGFQTGWDLQGNGDCFLSGTDAMTSAGVCIRSRLRIRGRNE